MKIENKKAAEKVSKTQKKVSIKTELKNSSKSEINFLLTKYKFSSKMNNINKY